MEEIIEKMETLILAETSEGESTYSANILDMMRLDDVHYYETVMRETR